MRLNNTSTFHGFHRRLRHQFDNAGGEPVALLAVGSEHAAVVIISWFIRQSEGRVLFDDDAVDHLASAGRGVGIVFVNYALFRT